MDILLPGPNADKRVAQLASEATYADLISAGIRIWNFQPSMLHTKIMVVDGAAALVGSSNVNRRSLEHDEEVAMVVVDRRRWTCSTISSRRISNAAGRST